MIKVSKIVEELLRDSEVASEALFNGLLNLNAYAKTIHPLVEERTMKEVQIGTIVVALSRISKKKDTYRPLYPAIHLDSLTVKSPLIDLTFEKSERTLQLAYSFSDTLKDTDDFFVFTQGIHEITFILSKELTSKILEHFNGVKPKAMFENLVAISVAFNPTYIFEPNVLYAILTRLAIGHINILEIVSTYTELTVLIEKKELESALQLLHRMFEK